MTVKDMKEELERAFPDSPHSSLATIDHALHGKRMVELVGRDYSLKIGSVRSPYANTPENKEQRAQVMAELSQYLHMGRIWVSVHATHWEVASRWKRASKASSPQRTPFSSVTAIDDRGRVAACTVVRGNVRADAFAAFFARVVDLYKKESTVFLLDNASTEDQKALRQIASDDKHAVLFNAPCSEELNPIERYFNEWKEHTDARIREWPGWKVFFDVLEETVRTMPSERVQLLFAYVKSEVIPRVVRREDLWMCLLYQWLYP